MAAPRHLIKICGLTCVEDVQVALDAGATAIGLNLWPASSRYVAFDRARELADYVGDAALRVAVSVDRPLHECESALRDLRLDYIQLHGGETAEHVHALLPRAFKAIRVRDQEDVDAAENTPGQIVLVDSKVDGVVGGSGRAFDWTLAVSLARERKLILAGGLYADNVASAIAQVRPWGVDVCSGVEVQGDPQRKDPARVKAFCAAARAAFDGL